MLGLALREANKSQQIGLKLQQERERRNTHYNNNLSKAGGGGGVDGSGIGSSGGGGVGTPGQKRRRPRRRPKKGGPLMATAAGSGGGSSSSTGLRKAKVPPGAALQSRQQQRQHNNAPSFLPNPPPKTALSDFFFSLRCGTVGTRCGGSGSSNDSNSSDGCNNSKVGRVTLVNWDNQIVMDDFVKVPVPVINYRTESTHLTPESLSSPYALSFDEVRKKLQSIIADKILVGHGLEVDLAVLGLSHPWSDIRDLAKYPRYMKTDVDPLSVMLVPRSLPSLAAEFLSNNNEGEDNKHHAQVEATPPPSGPIEEAIACMELYKLARPQWEVELYKLVQQKKRQQDLLLSMRNNSDHIPTPLDAIKEDEIKSDHLASHRNRRHYDPQHSLTMADSVYEDSSQPTTLPTTYVCDDDYDQERYDEYDDVSAHSNFTGTSSMSSVNGFFSSTAANVAHVENLDELMLEEQHQHEIYHDYSHALANDHDAVMMSMWQTPSRHLASANDLTSIPSAIDYRSVQAVQQAGGGAPSFSSSSENGAGNSAVAAGAMDSSGEFVLERNPPPPLPHPHGEMTEEELRERCLPTFLLADLGLGCDDDHDEDDQHREQDEDEHQEQDQHPTGGDSMYEQQKQLSSTTVARPAAPQEEVTRSWRFSFRKNNNNNNNGGGSGPYKTQSNKSLTSSDRSRRSKNSDVTDVFENHGRSHSERSGDKHTHHQQHHHQHHHNSHNDGHQHQQQHDFGRKGFSLFRRRSNDYESAGSSNATATTAPSSTPFNSESFHYSSSFPYDPASSATSTTTNHLQAKAATTTSDPPHHAHEAEEEPWMHEVVMSGELHPPSTTG